MITSTHILHTRISSKWRLANLIRTIKCVHNNHLMEPVRNDPTVISELTSTIRNAVYNCLNALQKDSSHFSFDP